MNNLTTLCVLVAPTINFDDLKDVKVKAGQPFDVKVAINGSPPPTVEWFLDDEPLEPTEDEELLTPSTAKEAQLAVKKADKKHRGKLKLVVKNEHGTSEAECNLVVLGKSTQLSTEIRSYLIVVISRRFRQTGSN